MKKATLLLPVISQPRYFKRINLLVQLGYDVTVLYFERKDAPPRGMGEGAKFVKLGDLEDKNYLRRVGPLFRALPVVRNDDAPLVYVFSIDLLLIAVMAGKSNIVFEIGDVREINNPLFISSYSFLLKRCVKIIVTSDRFAEYLSAKYGVHGSRFIFKPHVLEAHQFSPERRVMKVKALCSDMVCIGFVGLLRYTSVLSLLRVASCREKLSIRIHGRGLHESKIPGLINRDKDHFGGAFHYPDDLADIYRNIDINFVMYDSSDMNVRMALPNKLYESVYFSTPLIVSKGTYLSEIVEKWNVGISWDYEDISGLCDYLEGEEFKGRYIEIAGNCVKVVDNLIMERKSELLGLFGEES